MTVASIVAGLQERAQYAVQLPQGLAAVAQPILDRRRQLRGRAAVASHIEDGVVTETVGAAGRVQYPSFPDAVRDQRDGVLGVSQIGQDAVKTRAAPLVGDVRHLGEQAREVVTIARPFARIARRVDPRGALEGIHLEAGVVGERRPAGMQGGIAGFDQGVLDEAPTGLGQPLGHERHNRDPERAEDLGDLTELTGIPGGDHERPARHRRGLLIHPWGIHPWRIHS